jgi:hypothetical protein
MGDKMKSRTQVKQEVVQAGGTIDDAYKIIHARKIYVLRHSDGTYLTAHARPNQGDNCYGVTVELWSGESDPLQAWNTTDPENAEYVRNFSTPWYNAGHETPNHGYKASELSVVSIAVMEPEAIKVHIPTVEQYLMRSYGPEGREPNAGHLKYCLEMVVKGQLTKYGWHEYSLLKLDEDKKQKPVRTSTNG